MAELRLLASGRDADVYGIDGQRVLRRYRDGRDVSTEAEVMRHVRRFGYPVPQLYATGPGETVLQHLHGPTMLEALERPTVTAAALLRCTAVDPDQLDAVLARRRADPNLTTAEQALHPTAGRLISAREERPRGGSTDSSTR